MSAISCVAAGSHVAASPIEVGNCVKCGATTPLIASLLTEAGRLFLQEARDIIVRADHAAVMARRMGSATARQLRVGIGYCTDQLNTAALLSTFHDHHQDIHVETRTMSVPAQIAALLDGQLDVGFVRPPVDDAALNSEIVISEPFVVALPPTNHFASRPRLQLSALANEPFVLPPRDG